MQLAGAILAFLLLFGGLVGVLMAAGSASIDRPTAAEAFFEKYQQRAPLVYKSGHGEAALITTDDPAKRTASWDFDSERGAVITRNYVDGVLSSTLLQTRDPRTGGKVKPSFFGAEVKISTVNPPDEPYPRWERQPSSVRFREDPRAKELGARQLILEFESLADEVTPLTQLLMIDADDYHLIFSESNWGSWDAAARTWRYRTSTVLSHLDEPVDIPASVP